MAPKGDVERDVHVEGWRRWLWGEEEGERGRGVKRAQWAGSRWRGWKPNGGVCCVPLRVTYYAGAERMARMASSDACSSVAWMSRTVGEERGGGGAKRLESVWRIVESV